MNEHELVAQLNSTTMDERLAALRSLADLRDRRSNPVHGHDVNNHIHTTYSFSPYSPAKAVWMADRAGLATAGIMDHDSIGGAREFIEAGRILNLPTIDRRRMPGFICRHAAGRPPDQQPGSVHCRLCCHAWHPAQSD